MSIWFDSQVVEQRSAHSFSEGPSAVLIRGRWRGIRASMRAPDLFGFYLALGITLMVCVQAFINMSVVLGLLPTKGIPLPFLSYGGSSFVVMLAGVGILLNVSQHST